MSGRNPVVWTTVGWRVEVLCCIKKFKKREEVAARKAA